MNGGPVTVVTGGSRGIGLAIVRRLLAQGHRVAAVDINRRALEEAKAELAGSGGVYFAEASVVDRKALVSLREELSKRWGPVHSLVNNAGVNRPGTIFTQTDEQWDAVMETNLKGAFVATSVFAASMVQGGGGSVVNIGSTAASGRDGPPAYAASKAGLIGLTRELANELGPDGIRVNLVAPGVTLTGWVRRNVAPATLEQMVKAAPLGRAAEPEDVAAVVAFLCADDSRHVTGQVISISGGSWMP